MLRFYLDEHQPNSLAKELRGLGIDVQTAVEARMAGHRVPDPVQLSWAAIADCVFITGDWDFLVYGATVHPHTGVIIVPRHVSVGESIRYLELLATGYEPDDMRDRVIVFPNV